MGPKPTRPDPGTTLLSMSIIFDFCVASKKTNKEFRETKQTNMAIKRFRIFYGIRVLILTFQFHYIKVILIFLRNLHW